MTELRPLKYELVLYDCEEGPCLMLHEITHDYKIGALSLDHRSIGEGIVDELNELARKLYKEEMRTQPLLLDTHISDEDFKKIEKMLIEHFGEKNRSPFLKIHNDYFIQYGDDMELFSMHKPADIRSLCYLINREHGYSELQSEYNDKEM